MSSSDIILSDPYSMVSYIGSAEGRFGFSMTMYRDADMKDSLCEGAMVPVNFPIYVKITFSGPPSLKMVVRSCVATPTINSEHATVKWYLVKNGYVYST